MPSVSDVLAHQARDENLTEPEYQDNRRIFSRSCSSSVDNRPARPSIDEFGRYVSRPTSRCFSDSLGVAEPMSSGKDATVRPSSASGMIARGRPLLETDSPAMDDEAGLAGGAPPSIDAQSPTSFALLTRRRHQRPISLVVDNHRSLSSLDVNSNDGAAGELLRPATASPRQRPARLTADRGAVESLSKSCGDLQRAGEPETPPFARQFHPLSHRGHDPFRCPSHLSLCSVQVSSPTRTDSPAGSRASLFSEGPDSYDALCERTYKTGLLLGSQELPLPTAGRCKEERERMVREWLSKQQDPDETALNANVPPLV